MKKYNSSVKINSKITYGLRIICMICSITFLLFVSVGCTSYASSDDVSALQDDLNNALNDIDSINAEYEAALEELALLKSALENTNTVLDEFESKYETTNDELKVLEGKYSAAQEEIAALNKANTEIKKECEELNISNAEIDKNLQSAKQEIEELQECVDSANEKIDSLKGSYDAAQQEIESLKGQISDLEDKLSEILPTEKIKIYIDQGHNPTSSHNTGASGNGLYEQDVTFTIGIILAEILENDGRFEICLSRPTETTVLGTDNSSSLDARVQGAKDFGADYFISLHTNSYETSTPTGAEIYVADEESESHAFGSAILEALVDSTNLRNRGIKNGSHLRVLKNATMPAVLVEMGFISNPQDAALLSTSPELFAQGIYNGILDYFELIPV